MGFDGRPIRVAFEAEFVVTVEAGLGKVGIYANCKGSRLQKGLGRGYVHIGVRNTTGVL